MTSVSRLPVARRIVAPLAATTTLIGMTLLALMTVIGVAAAMLATTFMLSVARVQDHLGRPHARVPDAS